MQIIKQGYMSCDKGFVTLGRDFGKEIKIPVYCYLVKHPKGNVLIDSGIDSDFEKTWGKRLAYFKPEIIKDLLKELDGVKIDFIINTHLHLDHCGNNNKFDAEIIVQKKELQLARDPPIYQKFGYADSIEDLNYREISGELDLFGDDTIRIIPTPGHTKGHQSILVTEGQERFLIAGDACYTHENLKHRILPGIYWNAEEVMKQYELFKKLDAKVLFGHDSDNE